MLWIALAVFAFQSTPAIAKGGSDGGPVHASGYTGADGTHVDAYDRAPPGTAIRSTGGRGSSSRFVGVSVASLAGTNRIQGPPQSNTNAPAPVCEFKAVMTDDEIVLCRKGAPTH